MPQMKGLRAVLHLPPTELCPGDTSVSTLLIEAYNLDSNYDVIPTAQPTIV